MRKQNLLLFIFSFLGFQPSAFTQSLSPAEYYDYIQNSVAQGNIDMAIEQYDTLRQLAIAEEDSLYLAFSHSCVGEIHFMYKNMEASKDAYLASSKITQNFPKKDLYIKDCIRLLGCYKILGIHDSAYHYLNIADQFIRTDDTDQLKKRQFFNQKALFHQQLGQSDSAIYYFIKTTEFVDTLDKVPLIAIYGNIGGTFASRMNFKKALEYYDKILEMPSIESFPRGQINTLIKKAQALKHIKHWAEAKKTVLQAIDIEKSLNKQVHLAAAYCILADIYLKQGQLDLAKAALQQIPSPETTMHTNVLPKYYLPKIKIALQEREFATVEADLEKLKASIENSTKYFSYKIDYQYLKAQYLQSIGKIGDANTALQDYIILYDSFYTISQSNIIHDLESIYQTEIKENEIELLHSKNELASQKLSASRKQLIGLSLGLLVLGGLLFRVFNLNKKLETAVEQKDFLLKEIHHRVKNNLQFISSLLSLQSASLEDVNAIQALQEGQDRVQSMSLIHQKLYQEDNLSGIEIKDYFENLTESLFDSYNINPDRIHLEMDIEEVLLDVDTAIPIGLIVNELMSNALKYAFPDGQQGTILVALKEKEKMLSLLVQDNGVGMPQHQQEDLSTSFGYKLIHAFKTQLDADLDIQGDDGTCVELKIRDYKKL